MGHRDTFLAIHTLVGALALQFAANSPAQASAPIGPVPQALDIWSSVDRRLDTLASLLDSDGGALCDATRAPSHTIAPPLAWLPAADGAPLSGSEPLAVSPPTPGPAADAATRPWIATAADPLHSLLGTEDSGEMSALAPRLASRLPEPTSASIAFAGIVMLAAMALRRRSRG